MREIKIYLAGAFVLTVVLCLFIFPMKNVVMGALLWMIINALYTAVQKVKQL